MQPFSGQGLVKTYDAPVPESTERQKMKLIRFGEAARETPGIIMDGGTRLGVSALVREYDEGIFTRDGLAHPKQWLTENEASAPRGPQSARLGPPIARPSKIV